MAANHALSLEAAYKTVIVQQQCVPALEWHPAAPDMGNLNWVREGLEGCHREAQVPSAAKRVVLIMENLASMQRNMEGTQMLPICIQVSLVMPHCCWCPRVLISGSRSGMHACIFSVQQSPTALKAALARPQTRMVMQAGRAAGPKANGCKCLSQNAFSTKPTQSGARTQSRGQM